MADGQSTVMLFRGKGQHEVVRVLVVVVTVLSVLILVGLQWRSQQSHVVRLAASRPIVTALARPEVVVCVVCVEAACAEHAVKTAEALEREGRVEVWLGEAAAQAAEGGFSSSEVSTDSGRGWIVGDDGGGAGGGGLAAVGRSCGRLGVDRGHRRLCGAMAE